MTNPQTWGSRVSQRHLLEAHEKIMIKFFENGRSVKVLGVIFLKKMK